MMATLRFPLLDFCVVLEINVLAHRLVRLQNLRETMPTSLNKPNNTNGGPSPLPPGCQ